MKTYHIYLITNKNNKVLYTGITNDPERRILQHKNKTIEGFTKKYNCTKLVYLEECNNVIDALNREKQIKGWTRDKKNDLVNSINPEWNDLAEDWYE